MEVRLVGHDHGPIYVVEGKCDNCPRSYNLQMQLPPELIEQQGSNVESYIRTSVKYSLMYIVGWLNDHVCMSCGERIN